MDWKVLLYIAGAALMLWLGVRIVKNNPGSFSKKNMGKSAYTLGLLTLMIMGVIALCVVILKN